MPKQKKSKVIAIANFLDSKIKGYVEFIEIDKELSSGVSTKIIINLEGLPKNSTHGIHIHEAGDLSDQCISACAHFNPYNKQHGGIDSK
jgi:Cu-Zn family superoxide dismutase